MRTKFTESFHRTTAMATTVSNNFEFPPWCNQSLHFRIQIEAKQLKFCESYSIAPGCFVAVYMRAFAPVLSLHSIPSTIFVLSCTSAYV